ncbi:MAG: NADH:ubiquinone oxidoreductase subunit N, partial [Gammaproteobacteria bacterium]|nr:NADH:ubiquinone oxidoreductase subunit N [Gammaproteobacteria bacterium]
MEYNLATMQPVLPEIFLLTATCLILVVDLFLTDRTRLLTYGLSLATLIGAVALTQFAAGPERQIILDGSFVRDPLADVLKTGLLLVTLFGFVYAKDYLREQGI